MTVRDQDGVRCEYHVLADAMAEELSAVRRRYAALFDVLQNECMHAVWTGWMSGYRGQARLCRRCMKVMKQSGDFLDVV